MDVIHCDQVSQLIYDHHRQLPLLVRPMLLVLIHYIHNKLLSHRLIVHLAHKLLVINESLHLLTRSFHEEVLRVFGLGSHYLSVSHYKLDTLLDESLIPHAHLTI